MEDRNVFSEYLKVKEQIESLQEKLKEYEAEMLTVLEKLEKPVRTDVGTFSRVVRTYWTYSEQVEKKQATIKQTIAPLEKELKELQKREQEEGVAQKQEKISLRFITK